MSILNESDLQEMYVAARDTWSTHIETAKTYRVGRVLTDGTVQVYVPNPEIPGMVWVRPYTSNSLDGEAIPALNVSLTSEEIVPNCFVSVKPSAKGLTIVGRAPEDALYREGVPVRPQRPINISQFDVGLLRPMYPVVMRCIVSEAAYTLGNLRYLVLNRDTKDFTADIPVTVGLAVGILVEIDPATGTLYYTTGTTFNTNLTLKDVFNVNLIKTVQPGRFASGWVKLYNGMTAITINEVLAAQEVLAKSGSGASDIVTYRGQVVTFNSQVVTWSGL